MCGHLDNAIICLGFLNAGGFILNIRSTFFKNSLNGFLWMPIVRSKKGIREDWLPFLARCFQRLFFDLQNSLCNDDEIKSGKQNIF